MYKINKSIPKDYEQKANFTCIHRHNGLTHPQCYRDNKELTQKIGFLDIEASNLSSDFGCILSYCIVDEKGKSYKRVLTPDEIKNGIYDKNLIKQLCQDIRNFTRIITYYGSKFDIPFIRSRSLLYNLPFPAYGELNHTDAYLVVKYKLGTLHSRRLGVVAPFFNIEAKGHPLNPTIWLKCLSGNKQALSWVLTHNLEDCESLRKLWKKISKFTRYANTSV